ncbi:MAG: hypothetical protein L6R39_004590 [Caloplaca ligustica]|nr:MAG: hypothetical protein L6R39_004590 [Caloplaca ligustica]
MSDEPWTWEQTPEEEAVTDNACANFAYHYVTLPVDGWLLHIRNPRNAEATQQAYYRVIDDFYTTSFFQYEIEKAISASRSTEPGVFFAEERVKEMWSKEVWKVYKKLGKIVWLLTSSEGQNLAVALLLGR